MRLRARYLALALVVGVAACGAAPALAAHDSAASTSSTSLDDRGGGGGEAKAKAQASGDPPCLAIDYSNIGQLREPCEDPALACDDANGCVCVSSRRRARVSASSRGEGPTRASD
jgi:hypothetical protein